jgi:tetratricopeptide (TPR) repeat protein
MIKLQTLLIPLMIPLVLLVLLSFSGFTATCAAAKPSLYEEASKNYELQKFEVARDQFLKVVKNQQKSFRARFQLANCYAQLKDFKKARESYAACLTCKPDKETTARAQNAIQYLDAYMARGSQAPAQASSSWRTNSWNSSSSGLRSNPSSSSTSTTNQEPDQIKFLRTHKSEIMAQGEREAKVVMDQADKDIEDLKENGMYRYRDPDTGFRARGAPPYMIEQIKKEAQEKANEIKKEAKRRADAIHIPGEE